MVSQASYHASHADGKRPAHSYSPYMSARYTESRVYVPNNEHRGLGHRGILSDPVEKGEGTTRKRIAVACGRCRQRKIRCSGDKGQGTPCTNCHNAGVSPCLFLRVSSREATIKTEFDYNSHISRALAHRAAVPPHPSLSSSLSGPLPSSLSSSLSGPLSSGHYGTVPSDFSPNSSSSGSGSNSDPYRSTSSLYPYTHKAYYNSLPQPAWTSGYSEDYGNAPTDQSCSSYGVISEQTSQLMPPFTWDGRTPAGPPPPPLPLKVQAPASTSVPSLPPPAQLHSHYDDHYHQHEHHSQSQAKPQETQPQAISRCHCRECIEGHGQHQDQHYGQHQGRSSAISYNTSKPQTGLVLSQVTPQNPQNHQSSHSQEEHDASQYIHGELVYRPAQSDGNEATLASSSIENLEQDNDSNNTIRSSNNSYDSATQAMQTVPMSRAPSHGSVLDHGTPVPMSHFKQELISSRSAASSPAPVQAVQSKQSSSLQAHVPMPAPLPHLSLASQGHAIDSISSINSSVNSANTAHSPYIGAYTSTANSSENLARIDYPLPSNDNSRRSSVHVPSHAYSKDLYHETSHYVSTGSVDAPTSAPVAERVSEGSIFSDQERNFVGTQGPGPMSSCLDSYTYDAGPSSSVSSGANASTRTDNTYTAKSVKSSLSLSSLHGVYGRQNKKKSSTDSLVKSRPYSPAASPIGSMLPPSHHHGYDHGHIGTSHTPVSDSPLPPPMHTYADLQAHDIKADSPY